VEKMQIRFSKMQGLGNDFMVIDSLTQSVNFTPEQVRAWADRRTGIGFDQLLWLAPPTRPDCDAYYRIFNADGSEAQQCGNGARCVGRYLIEKGLYTGRLPLILQMNVGVMQVLALQADRVQVSMGVPLFAAECIPAKNVLVRHSALLGVDLLLLDQQIVPVAVLSMGNPHAVTWVADVRQAPVVTHGPLIMQHENFPEQINVGFAEKVTDDFIRLRVYERGSGETLACGSGACAAAVVGMMQQGLARSVQVEQAGGVCQVSWLENGEVILDGPAKQVYAGFVTIK
jgi:diaminopimelate epimerase